MTTLITGAGLIGVATAREALARREDVVIYDAEPRADYVRSQLGDANVTLLRRDVRDLPALVQAIQDYSVDTVVHTAGLIGARVGDPFYTGIQINVVGTSNVAEAVRLTGVRRLVHVSTYGVYDRSKEAGEPITESFPLGNTSNPYPATKVANEMLVGAYQATYGFQLVIIRPAGVYGMGHFWGGSAGGSAVHGLLSAGVRGVTATYPARQARPVEHVYGKDVGRAVDLACTAILPERSAFNVGNGHVWKLDETVATARDILPDLKVEVEGGKADNTMSQPLDLTASREVLGWEPRYSLAEGFAEYISELRKLG